MLTSLSTALSSMNANEAAISVVGNNLANLNTPGYKSVASDFRDLVSESINNGATQIGTGVAMQTRRDFAQGGTQQNTGLMTAAIQGPGFFALQGPKGEQLYTRAGNFKVDMDGNVTDQNNLQVLGWSTVGGKLDTSQGVAPIKLPVGVENPPKATSNLNVSVNLDATTPLTTPTPTTYTVPVQVVDSLGKTHTLSITMAKNALGSWTYTASLEAGAQTTPAAFTGPSAITFDNNGKYIAAAPPNAARTDTITFAGLADGAADLSIKWQISDAKGLSNITQYTQPSNLIGSTQDGYQASQLSQVSIADGGMIVGTYSDGRTQNLGQLAMAGIQNPDSLIAVGNNNFQVSVRTATPVLGPANTGTRGNILGNSLEASTVDIATEFTNLMVYQRSYQSSSKVITTADQIAQDTVNLIR